MQIVANDEMTSLSGWNGCTVQSGSCCRIKSPLANAQLLFRPFTGDEDGDDDGDGVCDGDNNDDDADDCGYDRVMMIVVGPPL